MYKPTLITSSKTDGYLQLSFKDFDQAPSGWRLLVKEKSYEEAANRILTYVTQKEGLDEYQTAILYFHAGQALAFNNNINSALSYFEKALHKHELENSFIQWNDYVNATIAFLKKDENVLKTCKTKMKDTDPNLPIVNNMLERLGESYLEVYNMPRKQENIVKLVK